MEYRHAPAADRGDLDAVLVSAPGRPTLPVRLTLELFGRAHALVGGGPVTVWDPCCGAGTTLAVLGLCRGSALSGLLGSDVDPSPLDLARRNLALLGPGGLEVRAAELEELGSRHGKPGYSASAAAARRLVVTTVPHEVAVADATDPASTGPLVERHGPQVVIADLPHGVQTRWAGADTGHLAGTRPADDPASAAGSGTAARTRSGSVGDSRGRPDNPPDGPPDDTVSGLVRALASVLAPDAVIAMAGRGRKLALPSGSRMLDHFRVGHRAMAIVRAGDVPSADRPRGPTRR